MTSVTQVIQSNSPSFALIRKSGDNGETICRAMMVDLLVNFLEYLNIGKNMNEAQVADTVTLLLQEYHLLRPDDFILFFSRAKTGRYGNLYDRIDGMVIFEWMNKYMDERATEIETLRRNEAKREDKATGEPIPMPDYIKEALKKATPVPVERTKYESQEQRIMNVFIKDFDTLWLDQGAKSGKKFVELHDKHMDINEYLQFRLDNESI